MDELGWRWSDQKARTVGTHLDSPLGCLEGRTIDVAGVIHGRVGHDGPNVVARSIEQLVPPGSPFGRLPRLQSIAPLQRHPFDLADPVPPTHSDSGRNQRNIDERCREGQQGDQREHPALRRDPSEQYHARAVIRPRPRLRTVSAARMRTGNKRRARSRNPPCRLACNAKARTEASNGLSGRTGARAVLSARRRSRSGRPFVKALSSS